MFCHFQKNYLISRCFQLLWDPVRIPRNPPGFFIFCNISLKTKIHQHAEAIYRYFAVKNSVPHHHFFHKGNSQIFRIQGSTALNLFSVLSFRNIKRAEWQMLQVFGPLDLNSSFLIFFFNLIFWQKVTFGRLIHYTDPAAPNAKRAWHFLSLLDIYIYQL